MKLCGEVFGAFRGTVSLVLSNDAREVRIAEGVGDGGELCGLVVRIGGERHPTAMFGDGQPTGAAGFGGGKPEEAIARRHLPLLVRLAGKLNIGGETGVVIGHEQDVWKN